MKQWWGSGLGTAGWACLGYDWGYVPLCERVLHIAPWSLTKYGVVTLAIAIGLNIFQIALVRAPIRNI